MSALPLVTRDLVRRLAGVDAAVRATRLELLAQIAGNPFGAAVHRYGAAYVLLCRAWAEQSNLNATLCVGPEHRELLPTMLAHYQQLGVRPRVTLLPGWSSPELGQVLAAHGLVGSSWSCGLYRLPTEYHPAVADDVSVDDVTDNAELFASLFVAGFGLPVATTEREATIAFLRSWAQVDWWRLYTASLDGTPCAIGVLAVRDGIGYLAAGATLPQYRGHGCQTALIWRRLADAARAGCQIVSVETAFDSTSQHNAERTGFRPAYTSTTLTVPPA
ncbi:MAG: GNAT family N-acetyltransferase [Fimbriimonadaceae bacterium]|nr:GNAT family N-acetyltransferase [Fimbriimonadaceae bacterium]